MQALQRLQTQAKAKLVTAPLFPFAGSVFFVMTQSADPHAEVNKFVQDDPYVKNQLVSSYRIREFILTDRQMDFERLSQKFLLRA